MNEIVNDIELTIAESLFKLHDSIMFYSFAHFPITLVYLWSIKFDFD